MYAMFVCVVKSVCMSVKHKAQTNDDVSQQAKEETERILQVSL